MDFPNTPYQPIDCNYYDILLERATRRVLTRIQYHTSKGPNTVEAVIEDVYTKNKEEFMRLNNSMLLRLDQLIEVDGIPLPEHVSCGINNSPAESESQRARKGIKN